MHWNGNSELTGNLENMCASIYKLQELDIVHPIVYSNTWNSDNYDYNIAGDISVFSAKYNLMKLQIYPYPNITGEIKSLKNLKKLYYLILSRSSVTGSKSDLYNSGANISTFYI